MQQDSTTTSASDYSLHALVAQTLVIELEASRLAAILNAENIDYILLKGASFNRWLNPDGGRWYGDVDLLVRPEHLDAIADVLVREGYQSTWAPRRAGEQAWTRHDPRTGVLFIVEVHWSLQGLTAPAEKVWTTLAAHREALDVHGVAVPALDLTARSYHVAHHAAQHGDGHERTEEDLRRALEGTTFADWSAAAELARQLGGLDYLAAGLRRIPEGAAIAGRLELSPCGALATLVLRAHDATGRKALHLQQLRDQPTWRSRMHLLREALVPPAIAMRERSPLARRGFLGLCAAYPALWSAIAWRLPAAEWRRRSSMATSGVGRDS